MEQAQRRLVGILDVVDGQHRTRGGSGQPQELGHGDEQALVGVPAGPRRIDPGQHPVDLLAVHVGQAVEQRRLPPAEIGDGVEQRRTPTHPRSTPTPTPTLHPLATASSVMRRRRAVLPIPGSPDRRTVLAPPGRRLQHPFQRRQLARPSDEVLLVRRLGGLLMEEAIASWTASRLGCTPSSVRSVRSRRSNWRRAP